MNCNKICARSNELVLKFFTHKAPLGTEYIYVQTTTVEMMIVVADGHDDINTHIVGELIPSSSFIFLFFTINMYMTIKRRCIWCN